MEVNRKRPFAEKNTMVGRKKNHRKRGMVEAGNFLPERGERRRLDEKKTTKTNKNMEKNILEKTKSLIGCPQLSFSEVGIKLIISGDHGL